MEHPGKPLLIDGDGNVLPGDFRTVNDALREARRLARKREDDIYVYIAFKRVGPKSEIEEEKLEEATS